jgi:hypothetical protein
MSDDDDGGGAEGEAEEAAYAGETPLLGVDALGYPTALGPGVDAPRAFALFFINRSLGGSFARVLFNLNVKGRLKGRRGHHALLNQFQLLIEMYWRRLIRNEIAVLHLGRAAHVEGSP